MSIRIANIRVKIERAKKHISDLEAAVRVFLDTRPYTIGTKHDVKTRKLVYYISNIKEVPPNISAIVGDALQNIRSSLDHLAFQLVLVNGQVPTIDTSFPIFDDAAKYKAGANRKIQGMSNAAIESIDAVKPYKGGNDALWKINKLNNIDKHRFVLAVGSAFRSVDLGAHMMRTMAEAFPELPSVDTDFHAFFKPADRMFPLKIGDELFIDAPDAKVNEKMQFAFDVAFGEAGIVEGDALIETLKQFSDITDNLILSFNPLL